MNVRAGSYILPASIVSGAGQGNSMAGAAAFNRMLRMGPYGAASRGVGTPRVNYGRMGSTPRMRTHLAEGGAPSDEGKLTPIIVAGGEFVVDPETVQRI